MVPGWPFTYKYTEYRHGSPDIQSPLNILVLYNRCVIFFNTRPFIVHPTSYYRQDAAKRQTAGIKFTRRPKIRFFTPQGRLVAPIHFKLGTVDGHVGPLACAKFHLNRHRVKLSRGFTHQPWSQTTSLVWGSAVSSPVGFEAEP